MNAQRGQGSLEYLLLTVIALTVVVVVMIFTQDTTSGVQDYDDLGLFEGAHGGGSVGGYSGGGLSGGGEDSDGDEIPDDVEDELGTNPNNPDSDGDGINDSKDPFPNYPDNLGDEEDMANDCNKLTSSTDSACLSVAVCSGFDVTIVNSKCNVVYDATTVDTDGDEFVANVDKCIRTGNGEIINSHGCSIEDCLQLTCDSGTVVSHCSNFNLICNSNGQHEYPGDSDGD